VNDRRGTNKKCYEKMNYETRSMYAAKEKDINENDFHIFVPT